MFNQSKRGNRVNTTKLGGVALALGLLLAIGQNAQGASRVPEYPLVQAPPINFTAGVQWQAWVFVGSGQVPNVPTSGLGQGIPAASGTTLTAPFITPHAVPNGSTINYLNQFDAYFKAPQQGLYTFGTSSDDGSAIYFGVGKDNLLAVDANYSHGAVQINGTSAVDLAAGYHRITVFYGQGGGTFGITANYQLNFVSGTPGSNLDGALFLLPIAPTPVITPASKSASSLTVTITTGAPANVYYTTDGSTPTLNGGVPAAGTTAYSGPFTLKPLRSTGNVVQAANIPTNYTPSYATPQTYTLPTMANPVFTSSQTAPNFTGSETVTMTSATAGAFIYYTTDGSTPTISNFTGVLPSPATITINSSTTVIAIASGSGFNQSAPISMSYTRTDGAPFIVSALASGISTQVNVVFNTAIDSSAAANGFSGNNPANYVIKDNAVPPNQIPVTAAVVESGPITLPDGSPATGDNVTVRLTTGVLTAGVSYKLTVSNIRDKVTITNVIGSISYDFQYFFGGGLYYERWGDNVLMGSNVSDLTSSPLFPDFPISDPANSPASGSILPTFEELPQPTNIASYGSRMRGYYIPPTDSSNYQFWLTADDSAVLSISSDDNPNRKSSNSAGVATAVNSRQWSAGGSTQPLTLKGGKRYYIETLHKQNTGSDNLAVTKVDYPQPPIDGATLPLDNSQVVQLTPIVEGLRAVVQPISRVLVLGQPVTLTFDVAGSAPRTVQWYFTPTGSAGPAAAIAGATSEKYVIDNISPNIGFKVSDGGTYYCVVSNPITASLISQTAVLKVLDTSAPAFTSISPNFGLINTPTNITVNGSFFVDGMQVVIGGVACTNIVTTSPNTITCTTPTLARGTYTVSVTKPENASLPVAPAVINYFSDDRPVATPPAGPFTLSEDPAAPFAFQLSATDLDNLPSGLSFQGTVALALTGGSTTVGKSLVTVASTAGVQAGSTITGTNLPANASVLTINSATTLTISTNGSTAANATGTGSNLSFTVYNPIPVLTLIGGTTTLNNANITVQDSTGALAGSTLTGTNITPGTTIVKVNSKTSITMSAVATATGNSPTVTVFNPFTTLKGGTIRFGAVTVTSAGAPTVVYTSKCNVTYQPALDSNNLVAPAGPDSFYFSASDNLLSASAVPVTLNVTPVNDPPTIAQPLDVVVPEDQAATVALTGIGPGGGTDELTQTLTMSISSDNPSLFQNATGVNNLLVNGGTANVPVSTTYPASANVTFKPNYGGATGVANVTITVIETNTSGLTPPTLQTVVKFKVTVNPAVNDAPVIDQLPAQFGFGDTQNSIPLSGVGPAPANNPDEAGQAVVLSVASSDPSYFTSLKIIQNGSNYAVNYNPAIAKHGPVTITVTVNDGQSFNNLTNMSFVLTLSAVNHPPTAKNDSYSAVIGKPLVVPAPGVLSNDIDIDGDSMTTVIAGQPTNGTVTLNADGSFTYTPNAGFTGTDNFSYQANDSHTPNNLSNAAVVTISVGPDSPPVTSNLTLSTPEDAPVSSTLPATDVNFDTLTYSIVTPPSNGKITALNPATGAFTYSPALFYRGTDSFTFKANDGQLDSNLATVSITMTPVNHDPVAVGKSVFIGLNTATVITLDASDVDNDPLTYGIVTKPVNGTLSVLSGNKITYSPKTGYFGADSFTFTANDGKRTSNTATISITVTQGPSFDSVPSIMPNPTFVNLPITATASATVAHGAATITWDFGDGSPAVIGNTVNHTYTVAGVYTVTTTASSPEGLNAISVQSVAVSLSPTNAPPGAFGPNVYGFLVGGSGLINGSSAKLRVNYVARDKTSLSVTVKGITFPSSLNLGSLVGIPGVLTIGTGTGAQQFVFTLDKRGRGKATGLPAISFDLAKGALSFKTSQRRELTDLIIAIGAANAVSGTGSGSQIIDIPVTLQIGNQLYLAMTVEVNYKQGSTTGQGKLSGGK